MTTLVAERSAQPPPGLEVRSGPLPGGGLVADYHAGAAALADFYAGHPGDIEAYRRKAAEVDARLAADARTAILPAIEPLGDAAGRLRRILDGHGFFVTTGQQPALYGGPLYTLCKVLAAIRLADVLEPLLERPVLALFWIGADDHDWDEANHATLLDDDVYARTLRVAAPGGTPPLPLSRRQWGADIERVNAELEMLLRGAPWCSDAMRHVHEAYRPESTVEASFAHTIRLLLHDRRVALISSAAPALRRAAAPVLRREAEHAVAHHAVLARQTRRLEALGYPAQVELDAGATNLMLVDGQGRDRLLRGARGWQTRRERRPWAEAELLQRIADSADDFSPNVLLRPVVESAVLPTIAYVAGPGELRYFAQIGCLFEAHGVAPPVVVPRPSLTLLDARTRRLLERLALTPDDFRRPWHELTTAVIRREVPVDATAALHRLRDALLSGYADILAAVEAIDPTLAGPLNGARNRSLLQAREAEKRIVRHLKRRNDVLMEQLRRAAASLQPAGAPQERVLSAIPLWARHGPGLVDAIEAALDMMPRHVAGWNGPRCSD